jgi:uncharacterized protein
MRIGVLSDTHVKEGELPGWLTDRLEGVDMILHAGDILEMSVVEQLSRIAETFAVRGNMDRGDTERSLPGKRLVEAGAFRIGLTHGSGAPWGMAKKVLAQFEGDDVDCVVFGHTHRPLVETAEGVLLFNPGSALDRRFSSRRTMGMLDLTDNIDPRIIDLEAFAR